MEAQEMRERAARALCRKAGYDEDMMFDGKPAWAWYLDQADAVLDVVANEIGFMPPDPVHMDTGVAI